MNCEEWWKVLGIQRLEEKKIKIKASLPQVTPTTHISDSHAWGISPTPPSLSLLSAALLISKNKKGVTRSSEKDNLPSPHTLPPFHPTPPSQASTFSFFLFFLRKDGVRNFFFFLLGDLEGELSGESASSIFSPCGGFRLSALVVSWLMRLFSSSSSLPLWPSPFPFSSTPVWFSVWSGERTGKKKLIRSASGMRETLQFSRPIDLNYTEMTTTRTTNSSYSWCLSCNVAPQANITPFTTHLKCVKIYSGHLLSYSTYI